MDQQVLKDLGLTQAETSVYLSLLRLGATTIGPVIHTSRLQSSTSYHAMTGLINKGLVSYVMKNNRKFFQAAPPQNLFKFMEEKKRRLEDVMPDLEELQKRAQFAQEATVYAGLKSMKTAFYDILETLAPGDEYYVMGVRGIMQDELDTFFRTFYTERAERGIKVKVLFNPDMEQVAKGREKIPLTEIRYMPKGYVTPCAINIYTDKTLFALWTKEPFAVTVYNQDFAESFRNYFQLLWKMAGKISSDSD